MTLLSSGTNIRLVIGINDMRSIFSGLGTKVQAMLKTILCPVTSSSSWVAAAAWSNWWGLHGDGLFLLTKQLLERGSFARLSAHD